MQTGFPQILQSIDHIFWKGIIKEAGQFFSRFPHRILHGFQEAFFKESEILDSKLG